MCEIARAHRAPLAWCEFTIEDIGATVHRCRTILIGDKEGNDKEECEAWVEKPIVKEAREKVRGSAKSEIKEETQANGKLVQRVDKLAKKK